jgi:hypothetical protein
VAYKRNNPIGNKRPQNQAMALHASFVWSPNLPERVSSMRHRLVLCALIHGTKNTTVVLSLWKKYRSAQKRSTMMACQMVKIVAQYERTCTNQLGPHGHCGNERPGGCAQINFPSGAKGAVRTPWTNFCC